MVPHCIALCWPAFTQLRPLQQPPAQVVELHAPPTHMPFWHVALPEHCEHAVPLLPHCAPVCIEEGMHAPLASQQPAQVFGLHEAAPPAVPEPPAFGPPPAVPIVPPAVPEPPAFGPPPAVPVPPAFGPPPAVPIVPPAVPIVPPAVPIVPPAVPMLPPAVAEPPLVPLPPPAPPMQVPFWHMSVAHTAQARPPEPHLSPFCAETATHVLPSQQPAHVAESQPPPPSGGGTDGVPQAPRVSNDANEAQTASRDAESRMLYPFEP